MRIHTTLLALLTVATLVAAPAHASDHDELARARAARATRLNELATVRAEIDRLLGRYGALERRAGRAWMRLLGASRAAAGAEAELEAAEDDLAARVRTAYQVGPGGVLEALLSAESFADLVVAREYTARTLEIDAVSLEALEDARTRLAERRAAAEAAREVVAARQLELRGLLAGLQARLREAERLAERAGVRVRELAAQAEAIREAAARARARGLVDVGATGADQSALLALLGPTGGRTCETPDGLVETGRSLSGYASWYGWEFGGQSTANGAIFDPRLFTAANRWLPFGTFLRVRYHDRCAIVLVNDRGPYGHLERVIDLSMASARYLGVGVSWVTADILLPRDALSS